LYKKADWVNYIERGKDGKRKGFHKVVSVTQEALNIICRIKKRKKGKKQKQRPFPKR
jgi:hypothetical protein